MSQSGSRRGGAQTKSAKRAARGAGTLETLGERLYRGRVQLADGTRKWLPVAAEFSYSEERAREWLAFMQEQEREKGKLLARKLAGAASTTAPVAGPAGAPVESPGDKWFTAWETSRKAKGLTSTRDNRSHYEIHIRPALDGKHVRDWTPEDVRALVRSLDAKVQAGTMH
jgi:hypothetical protein